MDERRKFQRRYLMYYSRIFDKKTGMVTGYIVDITPGGIMMISEEMIEMQKEYSFRMDLPEDISSKTYMDFEARSVWCRRDVDPHFYDIGFELTSITPEDITLINNMIDEYGFRDVP